MIDKSHFIDRASVVRSSDFLKNLDNTNSGTYPVGDWSGQEGFHCDTITAHQQAALWFEGLGEGRHAGMRLRSAATFYFDRRQPASNLHHKIHFMVALTPIVQATFSTQRRIGYAFNFFLEMLVLS